MGGLLSALLGSVPVVMAMIPLTQAIVQTFPTGPEANAPTVLWWALALGCCLGGCGTIVGAAANIVVVQIARRNDYHMSFRTFARYGIPTMFGCLIAASGYLYLRYFLLA
jgi:Na+/H+ antiporter NhaD/arsenite permease-like protein